MRDLKADLELCQRATPGPWVWTDDGEGHGGWVRQCPATATSDGLGTVACTMYPNGRSNGQFIAAAREGWPEAIRRALEAEKRVRILEHILRSLGVTPNDQAILERHLSEMGVGEEG